MSPRKVPNTISDRERAKLHRARKDNKESWFSKRNVDRRLKSSDQRSKSRWS